MRRALSYRKKHTRASESEGDLVNLTPLIDIVFVILILFILIAPLIEYDTISLAARKTTQRVNKKSLITIEVNKDNVIHINKNRVERGQFFRNLHQLYKTCPTAVPQLIQDHRASFGTYQYIQGEVERAGFEELDILLDPLQK